MQSREYRTTVDGSCEQATKTSGLGISRFVLAPALALGIYLTPLSLPTDAHRLLAIVVLAVALWVTEAVPAPVTALVGPALAVLFGIGSLKNVFAPFSDP